MSKQYGGFLTDKGLPSKSRRRLAGCGVTLPIC